MEGGVLVAIHRRVEVVRSLPLPVARGGEDDRAVDRVTRDDGCRGVEEGQPVGPDDLAQRGFESGLVSGPVATIAGACGNSVTSSRTSSMSGCAARTAVSRSANASRSTARAAPAATRVAVAQEMHDASQGPHLALELAGGGGGVLVLERVRAHELAEPIAPMCRAWSSRGASRTGARRRLGSRAARRLRRRPARHRLW